MSKQAPRTLSTACIVIALPVLDFGGIESHTVVHASGLLNIFGEVRVCILSCDGRAASDLRRRGVTVDVLDTHAGVRNPIATFRLWRYLRKHRPDILHARSGSMTVHGLLAGALAGIPVRIAEEVGIPTRGRVGRRVFPRLYRLATTVIGVSKATMRYLTDEDGVPASKAVVVYNAIDDRFFQVERHSDGSSLRRILAVGRLVPVKAHDVLLRAAAPLLQADPQLVLQIAGDGPERERLEQLADELDIASSVELLGHRADIDTLLAAADAYVMCSHSEGLPLSLVEAMAARVPVVATRVGGVPEVIPADAVGCLVSPSDVEGLREAIRRVLTLSESERNAMVKLFHEHAKRRFRSDRYISDLKGLYQEMLSRNRDTKH